ncbi:LOW QUALITY PROTEIN: uncharacterized protein ACNS7B_015859 [Menidia menidia]
MPAKTPMYLKTTTPKKGKRLRLRDLLSGDMISPPLGDVRHSAHVGAEGQGDMFGDVGFLQGKLDMLPSQGRPQNGHARSHSVERRAGGGGGGAPGNGNGNGGQEAHSYAYNGFHYQHAANGLLKTTVSMPVFIAHEQAPPKPPRLHLEDAAAIAPHRPPPPPPPCGNGVPADPCRDIALSPAVRRLVPSSGSFSEVSSEDSMSEAGGPLDARRGLSLDSDAGLSNEDLRSERSESPAAAAPPAPACSAVSRADSMAGLDLDLDLGPSILEDVLSIMDRYKATDDRCEL